MTEHDDDEPTGPFYDHLDRAWDLVSEGDLPGAMEAAEQSLELDAESPEVHNLLGYIHALEGNAEQALAHYREAITRDEGFVEAMLNAAEVLIHPLRDLNGAVAMIDEALDHCESLEERTDALLLKIDALLGAGEHETAAAIVRQLPEGPFEGSRMDFLVARAHFEVGEHEAAAPLFRAAALREPQNPEVFYYQGLLCEAQSDYHGAMAAWLHARELDLAAPRPPWATSAAMFERRVQSALRKLPPELSDVLEGALVYIGDVPGAEVVADGVDPRAPVLLEGPFLEGESLHVSRAFVYQRNLERLAVGGHELEEHIAGALENEILATLEHVQAHGLP